VIRLKKLTEMKALELTEQGIDITSIEQSHLEKCYVILNDQYPIKKKILIITTVHGRTLLTDLEAEVSEDDKTAQVEEEKIDELF